MAESVRNDQEKVLDVQNINVVYESVSGEVHAVNDVNMTLHRGEILGLAGESGSGKSTLAYVVARLLRPPAHITSGRVLYYPHAQEEGDKQLLRARSRSIRRAAGEGVDILALSKKELRAFRWNELAVVFQSAMNALNPVISIEKQVVDVLRAHRPGMTGEQQHARAIELFELVGIAPERLRSFPHELSGGMRQRAVIAIALALEPEIIIMDEPTTALDVVVQRDILTELMRLRAELGFAVIFITHDLSLLLEVADEVIIMYAGRMVERASRKALYRHPLHPYTEGLLHSFPTLDGPLTRMRGIPGTPPDLREVPPGCVFNPRCAKAFDECRKVRPLLLNPPGLKDAQERLVACHLYNPECQPERILDLSAQGAVSSGQGGEV